jgi:zinc protease
LVLAALFAAAAQTPPPKRPAAARPVAPAPSYKDLKFPAVAGITVPKVETVTLANGMKVLLMEDHELPLVDGVALVRTGNLFDPPDKVGLATITGAAIRAGGTITRTGDALTEQLDNIAASIESEIGESSGSVRFSALKANTDEVLAIFKEVLTSPALRQDKIDQARAQLHAIVAHRNDAPGAVGAREFISAVYGKDNSYGWQLEHTGLDRIHRADVQAFYRRYFFPANVILGISGDFDSAAMKASLEKLFGSWNAKQPAVPEFPKLGEAPAGAVYFAEKQNMTQILLNIGGRASEYRDKDYPALVVMTRILGGGSQSRLAQRFREKVGQSYPFNASWGAAYGHPGVFVITGMCKPASTVQTIKAIRDEIERMQTTEVSDAELKWAKDAALNGLVYTLDSRMKILAGIMVAEYFGYPRDSARQYEAGLAAVTRADVLRAAKEHLDPAKLITLAIGNPMDIGAPVESLAAKVVPIDLTIPPSAVGAVAADTAGLQKGKELLLRVQSALGGADKLISVTDFTQVGQRLQPTAAPAKETIRWLAPAYLREDLERPGQKVALYSDGKAGWISSPQGWFGLSPPLLRQAQEVTFRLYFSLLLSDRIPGRTVNAMDDNTVEISDPAGHLAELVVDAEMGLPVRVLYRWLDPDSGDTISAEDDFGDFRDTNGLKLPYALTEFRNGQKIADVAVTEMKFNAGLKVQDLSKRP